MFMAARIAEGVDAVSQCKERPVDVGALVESGASVGRRGGAFTSGQVDKRECGRGDVEQVGVGGVFGSSGGNGELEHRV